MRMPPAYKHLCTLCGQRATNLHEKLPRSRGGPRDAFNTAYLCGSGTTGCHGKVTANPKWARSVGMTIPGYIVRGVYQGEDVEYQRQYPEVAA